MEEAPKWEELSMDCLVNILARVGVESLLLDVPFVCKSWYKAACIPQCWSIIDFTDRLLQNYGFHMDDGDIMTPFDDTAATTSFIKYVLERGNEFTTYVRIPDALTLEALVFISNEFPNLRTLKLPLFAKDDIITQFPSLVSKWTRLESLSLTSVYNIKEMVEQISKHCSNFGTLEITYSPIRRTDASSIVTFLPNLKRLGLSFSDIEKESVLTILNGCKMLEYLDASYCDGFDCFDKDILEFASGNCTLKLEGSHVLEDTYCCVFE